MPDSEHLSPAERPEATGSWRPSPGLPPVRDTTPTVRSGSGGVRASASGSSGSGSGSAGSSSSSLKGVRAGVSNVLPMPVPGDRLESFELQEAIGVGGMGAVFLATDTRLQRQVALKILPPEQSSDPETVQRFYQEGRAAARLDHENIARVYTIGADRGYHFIAFEYIEGTTIRQKVERSGPLPVVETINYTLQIASALVHASERGVVHRDIKPSNIIVTPQGRAKLVDMGLARRFERGASDDGLTQSGMTLGTFDYISPEQARDPRDVDVRSDLYSLGCTMFHMLTGRPPFPEGTVLQKLLQHQEEPAPDVRTVNPSVPADLAAILLKLMAKDRDRRYQAPEQLVRDLLLVAGAQGLRSVSPEGLVWLANNRPPSWERHLVWALPAMGLAIVVLLLVWWGQVGEAPTESGAPSYRVETPQVVMIEPPASAPPRVTTAPAVETETPKPTLPEPEKTSAPVVVRVIPVASSDDLAQVLARAPSGSTLSLTDDGPYLLRPEPVGSLGSNSGPIGRDLTIRAAEGARPRLRLRLDRGLEPIGTELAMLGFRGGHVALEGLEFELDASMLDDPLTAIRAEDASLSLSRCRFRRQGTRPDLAPPSAVSVRMTGRSSDPETGRPRPVRLLGSQFDGGQVALRARGSADIVVRDCSFGPVEPAIWLDNTEAPALVPADLSLSSVRVVAGPSPVFRFQKTAVHVQLDSSVIAAPGSTEGTLVATDEPEALDWVGRDNLYGRIGVYLQPTDTGEERREPPILSFYDWAHDPRTIREARSASTEGSAWALPETDQLEALARRDPSPAFALAIGIDAGAEIQNERAVREPGKPLENRPDLNLEPELRPRAGGLLARILESPLIKRNQEPAPEPAPPAEERPITIEPAVAGPARIEMLSGFEPVPGEAPPSPFRVSPEPAMSVEPERSADVVERTEPYTAKPGSNSTSGSSSRRAEAAENQPMPMVQMPPEDDSATVASVSPGTGSVDAGGPLTRESGSSPASAPRASRPEREPARATALDDEPEESETEADAAIRSRSELERAIQKLDTRGGLLVLARDADFRLSTVSIPKGGRWTIRAAVGTGRSRPVLRFSADPEDLRTPPEVSALFRVAPGAALEVVGVDLVLDPSESDAEGRLAVFGIGAGSDLTVSNSTITVEGRQRGSGMSERAGSAIVALLAKAGPGGGMSDSSAASVRISQSLLRTAGDLVDVASGTRLDDLSLSNVVAACAGSLVHGHGLPRGQVPEPIKLVLRQVTARAEGGLVHLESALGEPELPVAQVIARDSILATTSDGDPLVRIEGQDGLDTLRDRVPWEGHSVFYHQIDTYRRDQTALSGTLPVGFKRPSWEVAVGPGEDDPSHGDARFERTWPPDRPLWSLQPTDVALEPDSPASGSGADLIRVPSGPETGAR